MSATEHEMQQPEGAEDFRFPETALSMVDRYSEADAALIKDLLTEGASILQKPAKDITATEIGLLLLANEYTAVAEKNQVLEARIAELEREIDTDSLTGLNNNAYLKKLLERHDSAPKEIESERRAIKEGEPGTAILMIDLNGFKEVNDTYGHLAGDLALQTVAKALRDTLRPDDNAVKIRKGGDEFIVLLHNILPEDVEAVTIRIHDAITEAHFPIKNAQDDILKDDQGNDVTASVGASIGVKMHRKGGDSLAADLEKADQAMYAAKDKKDSQERTIVLFPDFAQGVKEAQEESAAEADLASEPA